MTEPFESLMTVQEVMTVLNIHQTALYTLLKHKGIPAFKVGRLWRFDREEIRLWLERKKKRWPSK